MSICTCAVPTATVIVTNHLTDALEPSHSTYQCSGCGEFEIAEPDYDMSEAIAAHEAIEDAMCEAAFSMTSEEYYRDQEATQVQADYEAHLNG
jgi:hypothetical protein